MPSGAVPVIYRNDRSPSRDLGLDRRSPSLKRVGHAGGGRVRGGEAEFSRLPPREFLDLVIRWMWLVRRQPLPSRMFCKRKRCCSLLALSFAVYGVLGIFLNTRARVVDTSGRWSRVLVYLDE